MNAPRTAADFLGMRSTRASVDHPIPHDLITYTARTLIGLPDNAGWTFEELGQLLGITAEDAWLLLSCFTTWLIDQEEVEITYEELVYGEQWLSEDTASSDVDEE